MTKDGMTKEEKNIAEGIVFMLNQDLCGPFECPPEGCDQCPLHNVMVNLDETTRVLLNIPIIEG